MKRQAAEISAQLNAIFTKTSVCVCVCVCIFFHVPRERHERVHLKLFMGIPLGHGIRGEESFPLCTMEYFELLYQHSFVVREKNKRYLLGMWGRLSNSFFQDHT